MERIIGINLGTINSAAAIMQGGKPIIIPSAEGQTAYGKAWPSVVAFPKDGSAMLVGTPAVSQAATNPENTITKVKRKMGTDHIYKILGKEYKPQQISAFILQKIKKDAEAFTGDKITKAVIAVPAYFDDNQRQATKDAGTIAGLEVTRIINEPTAAALAFGLDKANQDMKILVFDFGGGTLDVTIMEMGGGVFEVMSTSGDTKLGGIDMDLAIMDYVKEEFRKKEGVDISSDKKAMERLREACEKVKIELSGVMETDINLPYIHEKTALEVKLTRAKLKSLVKPIFKSCKTTIDDALEAANISASDINKIVLLGEPTRMQIVKKFVGDAIGKDAEPGVDPTEAVALGAAVQAGIMAGDVESDTVLLDVTPLTLGIETLGGVCEPIIERNRTLPAVEERIFTTSADNQTAVTINVVQGERPMVADNVSLGSFNFVIPPAPRGVPQIIVKFHIDTNGIINITGKDLRTGKDAKITIESTTKLSDEEVEKLKQDAEKHAEEQRVKRNLSYYQSRYREEEQREREKREKKQRKREKRKEEQRKQREREEEQRKQREQRGRPIGCEECKRKFLRGSLHRYEGRLLCNDCSGYGGRKSQKEQKTEQKKEQKKQEKSIFYWSNFRETDYYVPQEWYGDKPSKGRTSDAEFDELVDEYMAGVSNQFSSSKVTDYEKEFHRKMLNSIFISEFAERRRAQPAFTNIKDEIKKKEEARKKEEEARKKEEARNAETREAETRKKRKERKLNEINIAGTHYDLFLIPKDATKIEIKRAYRELSLMYHPHKRHKEPKIATIIQARLNEAYQVLSNPKRRKEYDQELKDI